MEKTKKTWEETISGLNENTDVEMIHDLVKAYAIMAQKLNLKDDEDIKFEIKQLKDNLKFLWDKNKYMT